MKPNLKLIQRNYQAARERLEAFSGRLESDPKSVLAYGILCDGLEAAGYARALGKPEIEVHRWLEIAANAGRIVFSGKGEVILPDPLPGIEVETIVDTSDTNPWTYVQTIYAALVTGQDEIVTMLAGLDAAAWHSDQVQVSPLLDRFAFALARAASGNLQNEDLRALALAEFSDPDEIYWHLQARVLVALSGDRAEEVRTALATLADYLQTDAADEHEENDPDRFLQLPMLGLTALANRA